MNYRDLLDRKLVEEYRVTPDEINAILEAAKSDIKTAQGLLNSDVCWAFNIAYNSLLQAGIALMHSKGYRPIGEAKHVAVILFLKKAMGKNYEVNLDRLNQMRRRRNKAVYGILRDITEYEAKDSVRFAAGFLNEVAKFISES